jgi:hypothetical protein
MIGIYLSDHMKERKKPRETLRKIPERKNENERMQEKKRIHVQCNTILSYGTTLMHAITVTIFIFVM